MEANPTPSPDLSLQISPPNNRNSNHLYPANTDLSLSTQPINLQQRYQNSIPDQKTTFYPIFHGNNTTNFEYPFSHLSPPINGIPSVGPCYSRVVAMVTRLNGFPVLDYPCGRLGALDPSHGFMMNPRFMVPKIPGKRSTRAPRMRWTSSLHARFVRAVELLGGHESMFPSLTFSLVPIPTHTHTKHKSCVVKSFNVLSYFSSLSSKKKVNQNAVWSFDHTVVSLFFDQD